MSINQLTLTGIIAQAIVPYHQLTLTGIIAQAIVPYQQLTLGISYSSVYGAGTSWTVAGQVVLEVVVAPTTLLGAGALTNAPDISAGTTTLVTQWMASPDSLAATSGLTAIAISPTTGDYVADHGATQRDASGGLMNAVILRLLTPLGSYWAEPLLGSRLHELHRSKDVPRIALLAKQYCALALQGMLDDGRVSALDIQTAQLFDGWLRLEVTITAANGQRFTFLHPVLVSS